MSKQKTNLARTEIQNSVLELEKKYFSLIESIITSTTFLEDLKKIETETINNYELLSEVWNLKNKIKIPAERLVRYHFYTNLHETLRFFYPSPVSCDLALEMDDAILNVDIKTIDIQGNLSDSRTTQLEHNQTSFKNKRVNPNPPFPGFLARANLPEIDLRTQKPILTFLIKIIYKDNGNSFEVCNNNTHPTMSLTCIPNGILSNLFDYELLTNFKNYKYYSPSDGTQFTHKLIGNQSIFNNTNNDEKYEIIERNVEIPNTWVRVIAASKVGYYDSENDIVWVTMLNGSSNKKYILAPIMHGYTARYKDEWLKERFDDNNQPWQGLKCFYEQLKDIN